MAGLGVAEPHPGQMGWLATPYGLADHPFGFFFFLFWIFLFFKKKKCDGGILGISRPNVSNCHNLKVWGS
jgi:hypothetical protein